MLPHLRALETFVAETVFVFKQQKMFLNFFARKRCNIVVETVYPMFHNIVSLFGGLGWL